MKNQSHSYKNFYTKLSALLIILTLYTAMMPEKSFAETFSVFVKQDDFTKKFREGRDLIDSEDWAKAAERFAEITEKYPKNKSTDAALYWLAFCYKKQQKIAQTRAAVERLIKAFPSSSWVGDAKVLLLEIYPESRTAKNNATLEERDKILAERKNILIERDKILAERDKVLAESKTFLEKQRKSLEETERLDLIGKSLDESGRALDESGKSLSADLPLDGNPIEREDEIRLAAFQNLLASDPKKAIEFADDILRKDSAASELLKRQIVRSFRRSRFVKAQTNGTAYEYVRAATNIGRDFIPILREMLQKSFQKESNAVVRNELVYALADINDPEAIEYLIQTYSSTSDKEIKKTIIFALGSPAISLSGTYKGTKITAEPLPAGSGYDFNFEKLMEIFSAEKDIELKRAAFVTMQRFIRQSTTDGVIEKISRLYDAETDERFKISIINYFSQLQNNTSANPKDNRATAKLIDIAKNDKNSDLKFLAIYALRSNTNPEVVKFLKALIK